jgi:glycosyltransferase 2 family protein
VLPYGWHPMDARSARAARLGTLLGGVLVVLCVVFVGRRLVDEWSAARDALESASWGWLALAVVAAAAGMTLIAVGWQRVLEALGAHAPIAGTVVWYYVGEIGKYLPGTVWPILGRGELARRGGVPRAVAYQSVALSLLLLYLAAAVLGGWLVAGPALAVLVAAAVVALHPGVVRQALAFLRRRTGRTLDLVVPSLGTSALLVLAYLPAWLAIGTATWAVARALDPAAPFVEVVLVTAGAWLVGFLAVPVPGGVGVREAAFVAAATGLAPGVGAATAVVARLVFVAVDAAGAAVLAPRARRGARPSEPAS